MSPISASRSSRRVLTPFSSMPAAILRERRRSATSLSAAALRVATRCAASRSLSATISASFIALASQAGSSFDTESISLRNISSSIFSSSSEGGIADDRPSCFLNSSSALSTMISGSRERSRPTGRWESGGSTSPRPLSTNAGLPLRSSRRTTRASSCPVSASRTPRGPKCVFGSAGLRPDRMLSRLRLTTRRFDSSSARITSPHRGSARLAGEPLPQGDAEVDGGVVRHDPHDAALQRGRAARKIRDDPAHQRRHRGAGIAEPRIALLPLPARGDAPRLVRFLRRFRTGPDRSAGSVAAGRGDLVLRRILPVSGDLRKRPHPREKLFPGDGGAAGLEVESGGSGPVQEHDRRPGDRAGILVVADASQEVEQQRQPGLRSRAGNGGSRARPRSPRCPGRTRSRGSPPRAERGEGFGEAGRGGRRRAAERRFRP